MLRPENSNKFIFLGKFYRTTGRTILEKVHFSLACCIAKEYIYRVLEDCN